MAIDLIVQHIRELLNYRNGNGLQQQRDRQILEQQQQQHQQRQPQAEESGKRNRHNSDSFFTRPH